MVLSSFQRETTKWSHPSRARADNETMEGEMRQLESTWFGTEERAVAASSPAQVSKTQELNVYGKMWWKFTSLFLFMETQYILDAVCENDMYALHYVFYPEFRAFWTDL